ncbi:Clavaminate synthase-like protein [Hesseltinella vesiculosa]|uniref:Clavaminate synthase-like protein n=1 Tax=Hesseltinella vesiculosa TaxID=101127 RepID=A0A1X2GIZ8_9FUNG|nr:Clavaminate synthase-like protein [Hesseltinella vesiculosa]
MAASTLPATQLPQANGSWRGFSTTKPNVIQADFPDRLQGPAVWDGKDLENRPEEWIYHVTAEDIQDIDRALQHFNALQVPLVEITQENFPLTSFAKVIEEQKETLFKGRGFGLIRGFPAQQYERQDQAAIFMGIGAYIGSRKPQNLKGHVLGHVKDISIGSATKSVYNADDPTTRIYATRKAQPFHVDGTDVVGLFCLTKGYEGGLSSLVSSHTIYNKLQEQRPDIIQLLKSQWLWDRKGEHGPDEAPYMAAAPMVYHNNHLFTFWGPHFFETMTRFKDVSIEPEKFEAMKYIQDLCEKEALNMELQVGDIQLVQNYQILHARTAYTDRPGQARHLLRLWLMAKSSESNGWVHPFQDDQFDYEFTGLTSVPLEAE